MYNSDMHRETIRIGISSCLIGEPVRYNGAHKRDRYLTDVLSRYFEYVPFCPEVAIGLGVPRATIQLQAHGSGARAIQPQQDNRDVTDLLADYGRTIGRNQTGISGYIFKARSPSCGMERVKVYDRHGAPSGHGAGIYAAAFRAEQPLLPAEEEGRLNDPDLRDNFIERVFVYDRWRRLEREGITTPALVDYHTQHKFLILAHSQPALRELGRLVANPGSDIGATAATYITQLMRALAKPAKRGNQANALQHIAGFIKDNIDAGDRRELADAVDAYRRDELPIIVPLTLIRHHLRRNPDAYLESQRYIEERPAAIDTRRR